MRIEHLALWTRDLDRLRIFYEEYFGGKSNEKYVNPRKGFSSYFLSFGDGPRLELMQMPGIPDNQNDAEAQYMGLIHFAYALADKGAVDRMAARFRQEGFPIIDGPRVTGDGYYEFTVLDPDRNRVEVFSPNEDTSA